MRLYLNDLSIAGQYADAAAFRRDLEAVIRARAASRFVRERLHCTRAVKDLRATPSLTFAAAVRAFGDRDLVQQVLGWIGKHGPFVEDDRATNPDDLFYFGQHDVTDQGLGETARRRLRRDDDAAFSSGDRLTVVTASRWTWCTA